MTLQIRRALGLLLVLAPSAWSQVTIPDTPVGHNFSAMLGALNSRDREVVSKYIAQYGRGESPDDILRTSEQVGRLQLVRILKSDRLGLQFIVETASGLQLLGMLRVEDSEPARVAFSLPWTPVLPGATVIGYDIDAATRSHVVEEVAGKLRRFYVLGEPAEKMADALAQHQRNGDYDDVTNGWVFANRLTEDLQTISNDKHLVVSFGPVANGPPVRSPYTVDARPANRADCGFERSETLPGEIGYVKIDQFVDPNVCRQKVVEALTSLVGVKGLVFDLRDAVGGHAGMATFILGQLFDEPVQLSAIRSREPPAVQPLHAAAHVSGLSFAATPVYVLTSSKTFPRRSVSPTIFKRSSERRLSAGRPKGAPTP